MHATPCERVFLETYRKTSQTLWSQRLLHLYTYWVFFQSYIWRNDTRRRWIQLCFMYSGLLHSQAHTPARAHRHILPNTLTCTHSHHMDTHLHIHRQHHTIAQLKYTTIYNSMPTLRKKVFDENWWAWMWNDSIDENSLESMRIDKNWWELMWIDENWCELMKIDVNWCELIRIDENW
jgi:hypothetical protein